MTLRGAFQHEPDRGLLSLFGTDSPTRRADMLISEIVFVGL
jgi:hypothetical protein